MQKLLGTIEIWAIVNKETNKIQAIAPTEDKAVNYVRELVV